ncbi:MAG TPA: hypothetical protein VEI99_09100 [Terriglobales bacterium]|nr:hypothetical protein [Terriglobales bacterium]
MRDSEARSASKGGRARDYYPFFNKTFRISGYDIWHAGKIVEAQLLSQQRKIP